MQNTKKIEEWKIKLKEEFENKFGCDQCDLRNEYLQLSYSDWWVDKISNLISQAQSATRKEILDGIDECSPFELKMPDGFGLIGRTHTLIKKEDIMDLLKVEEDNKEV